MRKLVYGIITLAFITCIYSLANGVKKSNNTDVIQMYLSAYEEEDSDKRLELINEIWTESSFFKDRIVRATGIDEFNSMIESFRIQIPGLRVESQNHFTTGLYRSWEWQIYNGDDQLILSGYDFAELNEENKIIRVYAYFD